MKRPISRLALFAAIAVALSGCATFTDDNVAARVGDTALSYDEFADRFGQTNETEGDRIPAEAGRSIVSNWIALELSRPAGILDLYSEGPIASGVLCAWVVGVPNAEAATAAIADLSGGADWGQFVTDTQPEAVLDGRIECLPTSELGEDANQLAAMEADNPYVALTFPDGSGAFVIRMQQLSDVNGFELLRVYQTIDPELVDTIIDSANDADVYVDPSIGAFDVERFGVAPLG